MNQVAKVEQQENLPTAQVSESNGLMSLVERMAVAPDNDPDRVERAFEMYKQVRGMEVEQAFNLAMAKAQAEIEPVVANKRNDHTSSNYANLSALHKACKPIWTAHGFSVSSSFYDCGKDGWIGVDCEVMHSGGHVKRYKNPYPLDIAGTKGNSNKTAIQAIGSTGSYARRYVELMVFDVSVGDDNDGNTRPGKDIKPAERPVTEAMMKQLRDAMKMSGVTEKQLCDKAQIPKLEELQQGRVKGCMDWLKQQAQK